MLDLIGTFVNAACRGSAYGAFDSLFVIVYYACIQMYTVLALASKAHHFPFVLWVTATTVLQCCLRHCCKPVVVPFFWEETGRS